MLPVVKEIRKWPSGNSIPAASNILHWMDKRAARVILAENLKRLMDQDANLDSGPKLARARGRPKIAPKTVNNVLNKRHNTRLGTIEKLAERFGLEAYQILIPAEEETLLQIVHAYNDGDGRRLLKLAADTALLGRDGQSTGKTDDGGAGAASSVPSLHARKPK